MQEMVEEIEHCNLNLGAGTVRSQSWDEIGNGQSRKKRLFLFDADYQSSLFSLWFKVGFTVEVCVHPKA